MIIAITSRRRIVAAQQAGSAHTAFNFTTSRSRAISRCISATVGQLGFIIGRQPSSLLPAARAISRQRGLLRQRSINSRGEAPEEPFQLRAICRVRHFQGRHRLFNSRAACLTYFSLHGHIGFWRVMLSASRPYSGITTASFHGGRRRRSQH